jgi:hypothetical protein
MAKALFHKNQRVYVKPVGTWALVERVVPHWTKGLDEPIRIMYDVGLGRHFTTDELQAPTAPEPSPGDVQEQWRIVRAPNAWQAPEETNRHPHPGTCPVVVTGDPAWGGWRVSGAEYALSPSRIERQARMVACTPRLAAIIKKLSEWAAHSPNDVPEALRELARLSRELDAYLEETG